MVGKLYFMFVALAILVIAILLVSSIIYIKTKNKDNSIDSKIIRSINPDNISPKLKSMIQYHKENGAIDYIVE